MAGLDAAELDLDRVGIYLGSGEGSLDFDAYTAAALASWKADANDVDYVKWAGPDDVAAEWDHYGLGRTFPHPLSLGKGKDRGKRNYYEAMATSPMGNEWLLELVHLRSRAQMQSSDGRIEALLWKGVALAGWKAPGKK